MGLSKLIGKAIAEAVLLPVTVGQGAVRVGEEAIKQAEKRLG